MAPSASLCEAVQPRSTETSPRDPTPTLSTCGKVVSNSYNCREGVPSRGSPIAYPVVNNEVQLVTLARTHDLIIQNGATDVHICTTAVTFPKQHYGGAREPDHDTIRIYVSVPGNTYEMICMHRLLTGFFRARTSLIPAGGEFT